MCEDLELYALDALDSQARDDFTSHLEACAACREALPGLLEATAALALDITPVSPPARLRMNVLAIPSLVEQEMLEAASEKVDEALPAPVKLRPRVSRPRWRPMAAVAASLAMAFTLGLSVESLRMQQDGDRSAVVASGITSLEKIKLAADYTQVNTKVDGGGEVAVAYAPSINGAILTAKGMPELKGKEVYQVWYLDGDKNMVPVGDFTDSEEATLSLDGDLAASKSLGITREPNPGNESPTSGTVVALNL